MDDSKSIQSNFQEDEIIEIHKENIIKIRKEMEDVYIIFVDLVDSTGYKLKHDELDWISRQATFLKSIHEKVNEFNNEKGFNIIAEKFLGDGIMLCIKEKVIELIYEIKQTINKINDEIYSGSSGEIKFRLACDYGKVHLLKYKVGEVTLNDPIGEPCDRASRLEGYANENQILFSEDACVAIKKAYENKMNFKSVEGIYVKGAGYVKTYEYEQLGFSTEPKSKKNKISILFVHDLNCIIEDLKEQEEFVRANVIVKPVKDIIERIIDAEYFSLSCIEVGKNTEKNEIENDVNRIDSIKKYDLEMLQEELDIKSKPHNNIINTCQYNMQYNNNCAYILEMGLNILKSMNRIIDYNITKEDVAYIWC